MKNFLKGVFLPSFAALQKNRDHETYEIFVNRMIRLLLHSPCVLIRWSDEKDWEYQEDHRSTLEL